MQKEEYIHAERYFKFAANLNPKSAMIRCHLGTAQVALNKLREAKNTHEEACKLDPSNTQCKYYLADVLFQIGDYSNAIVQAEKVKLIAPKEPSIYDLLA